MQVCNVLHVARSKCRIQKIAICATSHNFVGLYLCNEGMYRQSERNLLNSNISSRCPHNMANFGPLTAEIGWRIWGTPANFNGFRVLALLLQWHHSLAANQTLHDVWLSPGLVYYIYTFFGGFCPGLNFARHSLNFASMSCILLYRQHYCTALDQWLSAKLCGMVHGMELRHFCRRYHLYSAGHPLHWALAHILVSFILLI